jgi:hypothetical protein
MVKSHFQVENNLKISLPDTINYILQSGHTKLIVIQTWIDAPAQRLYNHSKGIITPELVRTFHDLPLGS